MSRRKRAPFEFHPLKIAPKPGELPDFVGTSSEPPDFMRGAGTGTEKIGPDDVVRMTPDAEGQLEAPLPKKGYQRYSPFDLVLVAIIRAHPKKGKGKLHERLKRARAALFGKPGRGRGHSRTDDKILLKVARRVFEAIIGGTGDDVELAPLIREFAAPHYNPEELARSEESANSVVRRLSIHFNKQRDEFLTHVTTPEYYTQARIDRIIDEILDRLESLGVTVRRIQKRRGQSRAEFKAK